MRARVLFRYLVWFLLELLCFSNIMWTSVYFPRTTSVAVCFKDTSDSLFFSAVFVVPKLLQSYRSVCPTCVFLSNRLSLYELEFFINLSRTVPFTHISINRKVLIVIEILFLKLLLHKRFNAILINNKLSHKISLF